MASFPLETLAYAATRFFFGIRAIDFWIFRTVFATFQPPFAAHMLPLKEDCIKRFGGIVPPKQAENVLTVLYQLYGNRPRL